MANNPYEHLSEIRPGEPPQSFMLDPKESALTPDIYEGAYVILGTNPSTVEMPNIVGDVNGLIQIPDDFNGVKLNILMKMTQHGLRFSNLNDSTDVSVTLWSGYPPSYIYLQKGVALGEAFWREHFKRPNYGLDITTREGTVLRLEYAGHGGGNEPGSNNDKLVLRLNPKDLPWGEDWERFQELELPK